MCKVTSKLFLLVTGVLFWAAATVLCAIGGYILYEYRNYEKIAESTDVLVPASLLIAVGVFLFLLGVVGCVGACKEQKCLLGFFFVILMIIFLGLISATVLSFVFKDRVEDALTHGMEKGLEQYGQDDGWTDNVDFIQSTFHCCGSTNYTDWLDTYWYRHQNGTDYKYPNSCCKHGECHYNATGNSTTGVFDDGCYTQIHDSLHGHFMVLLGVAAALAFFQLLGMIASCVLLCKRRSEVPYIGLVEPSGMRV